MPKKTLYVKDADLPIWEAAEKILGEKSMSTFVVEALRAKLNNPRDGFLNILCANTGVPLRRAQFAVMFAPTDISRWRDEAPLLQRPRSPENVPWGTRFDGHRCRRNCCRTGSQVFFVSARFRLRRKRSRLSDTEE